MRKSLGMLIGVVAFAVAGVGTANAEVLFDQTGPPLQFDQRSDKYDPPSDPINDIVAADDFFVPAGQTWTIDTIGVLG